MKNEIRTYTVCIIGRPNVGKSSLFNRLSAQRRAVVVEKPGTTRDRLEVVVPLGRRKVRFVDTGGFLSKDKDLLAPQIRKNIDRGMGDADLLLLVCDAISGLTPQDREIAELARVSGKPVLVVANKVDNDKLRNDAMEFFSLGFGKIAMVSCQHGRGVSSLRGVIKKYMSESDIPVSADLEKAVRVAVVGRPNVGKSSLVNRLLAEERVIVSEKPGTTRDSIDSVLRLGDDIYVLIDTAGIRHKRKITEAVDVYSIMRAKDSVARADAAVLMLDAADGITRDDMRVLQLIETNGRPLVVAVNKWDLSEHAEDVTKKEYQNELVRAHAPLGKYPVVFISAVSGVGMKKCMQQVAAVNDRAGSNFSTSRLNAIFERDDPSNIPLPRSARRPNFMYLVQTGARPVQFKYFVNYPSRVKRAHLQFIENRLRENLPLEGVPIKIQIARSKKNPVNR